MCDILDIQLPAEYQSIAGDVLTNISYRQTHFITEGGAFFLNGKNAEEHAEKLAKAIEEKAKIIFVGPNGRNLPNLDKIPHVVVANPFDAIIKLSATIRETLGLNVVGITGSLGKTTTKGIASYKSVGIRQNLTNVGGYQLFIDCYNTAPISLLGTVDVVGRLPIEPGGKRIAVLGDIARMGDKAEELHIDTGKKIGASGSIDLALCFGNENARIMADAIREAGTAAAIGYVYTSAAAFKFARQEKKTGIMVTGIMGTLMGLLFLVLLLVPVPGLSCSFGKESYICLSIWAILGVAFYLNSRKKAAK